MNFLGFDITSLVLALKTLGFILSLLFTVGIVISWLGKREILLEDSVKRTSRFEINQQEESENEIRWNFIKSQFQSKNSMEWRMAIIDADAMLEDLITEMGAVGDGFAEKLKTLKTSNFPLLNEAWTVHKLRNVLVHQGTSYFLSDREAYQTFKTYEQIFHDTGYIV